MLNILSQRFFEKNPDNLISIFRNFLKHQLGYLRKITFYTLFNLKGVMACIWRMKSIINGYFTRNKQDDFAWSREQLEDILEDARYEQELARKDKSFFREYNISKAEWKAKRLSEKLTENQSFSSNPNIIIPNVEVKKTGWKSFEEIASSFLNSFTLKE